MAFEGYSLYPPLTVRDNIAFALKRGRLSGSEVAERVRQMSALVEIEFGPGLRQAIGDDEKS